ncbi:hypothetical protein [Vibrio phage phiKT1019]|nr:hypothetical protein [Vibrio phage phiKT1019]
MLSKDLQDRIVELTKSNLNNFIEQCNLETYFAIVEQKDEIIKQIGRWEDSVLLEVFNELVQRMELFHVYLRFSGYPHFPQCLVPNSQQSLMACGVDILTKIHCLPPHTAGVIMRAFLFNQPSPNQLPLEMKAHLAKFYSSQSMEDMFEALFNACLVNNETNTDFLRKLTSIQSLTYLNGTGSFEDQQRGLLIEGFVNKVRAVVSFAYGGGNVAFDLGNDSPLYSLALNSLFKSLMVADINVATQVLDLLLFNNKPAMVIELDPNQFSRLKTLIEFMSLSESHHTNIKNSIKCSNAMSGPISIMGQPVRYGFQSVLLLEQELTGLFNSVTTGMWVTPEERQHYLNLYLNFHTKDKEYMVMNYSRNDLSKLDRVIRILLEQNPGKYNSVLEALTCWHGIKVEHTHRFDTGRRNATLETLVQSAKLEAYAILEKHTAFLFENRKLTHDELEKVKSCCGVQEYRLALSMLELETPDIDLSSEPSKEPVMFTPVQLKVDNIDDACKVAKFVFDSLEDKVLYQGGDLNNVFRRYLEAREVNFSTLVYGLSLLFTNKEYQLFANRITKVYEDMVTNNSPQFSATDLDAKIAEALYKALTPTNAGH